MNNKEIKAKLRRLSADNPEKFYPVNKLKELGFERYKCKKCGRFFWSSEPREVCGDSSCIGGYKFINKALSKSKLSYADVWKRFSKIFSGLGYTPIKRYPVAARWRKDTDFVQASIYDFQPYVVSGEIEPPANPLVVPQFCLRFNDIDNVGLTGSHYTGFVMIGQHAFKSPEEFKQEKYFEDIYTWLVKGLGIPKEEFVFHEDSWAGGGNAGVSLEFFSGGLELGNQVYTGYKVTDNGLKPLSLKVLDMGMGQERNAWFSQGTPTSYDAVFPRVMNKLYYLTGMNSSSDLMKDFLPYASMLNADENDDLEKSWEFISRKINYEKERLKKKILKMAALYSIAEHSRTLLVALSDSVLPSNVGGGYNLRMLLRRALSLIKNYKWDIELNEIIEEHAKELKPLFPELSENLDEVESIIEVEKRKYKNTLINGEKIVNKILSTGSITKEKLVELYDSQGINPHFVAERAREKNIRIDIPDNFYSLISERHHSNKSEITQTKKSERIDFETKEKTKVLYFDDYLLVEFKARVLDIVKKDNLYYVILDQTGFYPTSGGQLHDEGSINNNKIVDIFKQDNLIVHVLRDANFKEGDIVECHIDAKVRKQLAQHHTSVHIINGSARALLGNHIWQAGSSVTTKRARLDITHYEQLSDDEIREIERKANEIVRENLAVKKYFLARNVAEQKFGFRLYQGGAVPGKELRIVEIPNFDVEACGGTHLNSTGEAELIKILKTSKIQDSIVRIEFVAGEAARNFIKEQERIVDELSKVLNCSREIIPSRVEELFREWKIIVKKGKKKIFKLKSGEKFSGDSVEILKEASKVLKTQPEFIIKTVKRFLSDIRKVTGEDGTKKK